MNTESIAEYRASSEAAAAVTFAEGLRSELLSLVASGAMTEEHYLVACASGLDEIRERCGTDPRPHARKAARIMNRLVVENEPLVKKVARRTLGARAGIPANLEEAIQEGSIGLVRAIEGFDVDRGKFSTWAAFQIRHHVQTCMHKQVDFARQRSACMPPKVVQALNKFRLLHGRDAAPEELVYTTNDGETKNVTQEQWDRWLDVTHTVSVEDMGAREDGAGGNSAELVVDESTHPDAVVAGAHLSEKLAEEMATMSPRNRELTKALFIEGRTFADVANEFALSSQRIHQLKNILEKRLRRVLAA